MIGALLVLLAAESPVQAELIVEAPVAVASAPPGLLDEAPALRPSNVTTLDAWPASGYGRHRLILRRIPSGGADVFDVSVLSPSLSPRGIDAIVAETLAGSKGSDR